MKVSRKSVCWAFKCANRRRWAFNCCLPRATSLPQSFPCLPLMLGVARQFSRPGSLKSSGWSGFKASWSCPKLINFSRCLQRQLGPFCWTIFVLCALLFASSQRIRAAYMQFSLFSLSTAIVSLSFTHTHRHTLSHSWNWGKRKREVRQRRRLIHAKLWKRHFNPKCRQNCGGNRSSSSNRGGGEGRDRGSGSGVVDGARMYAIKYIMA